MVGGERCVLHEQQRLASEPNVPRLDSYPARMPHIPQYTTGEGHSHIGPSPHIPSFGLGSVAAISGVRNRYPSFPF